MQTTIQIKDRGQPVDGATVLVGEQTWTTNEDGEAVPSFTDDVQLVKVEAGERRIERWVMPGAQDGPVVIDFAYASSTASLVQDLVGERYRFLEVLGRGGMGVVVKAHDSLLNRVVAMKMLSGDLEANEEAQRIFLEEARALAPLSHPNLVAIHDIQYLEGRTLMVLEFVVGQNLDSKLKKRDFTLEDVLRYVIQMARATSFMHSKGFIHRDLKPANAIVGDDGTVTIIDFGLARSLDTISSKGTQIRGTPAYMAPEQVLGGDLTEKVDSYQLGVTLFELITGRLPFEGDMAYAHVHSEPPRLVDIHPGMDAHLSDLVGACLSKEPNRRPSAEQLLDELQHLYLELADADALHALPEPSSPENWRRTTGPLSTGGFSRAAEEPPKSNVGLMILVAVVCLALGGGGAYLATRDAAPTPGDGAAGPTVTADPVATQPQQLEEPKAEPVAAVAAEPDAGAVAQAPDSGTDPDVGMAEVVEPEPPAPKPQVAAKPKPVKRPTTPTKPVEKPAPTPTKTDAPAIRTTRRASGKTSAGTPPADSAPIRLSR